MPIKTDLSRNSRPLSRTLNRVTPPLNYDLFVELMSDPIIRAHFTALYDNLLEQNLLRIVEPFSRVEVAHVASLVGLPVVQIEFKYASDCLFSLLMID
jgi:hypothetical protein